MQPKQPSTSDHRQPQRRLVRWLDEVRAFDRASRGGALELNVYLVPTRPDPAMASAEIEDATVDLVREVRQSVRIPLAIRLSPFYKLAALAARVAETGANGLVLFNRFIQPDIDLDALTVVPRALLSHDGDGEALRLPLRWIALLYGRLGLDLAATGRVHTGQDALKLLMVGANVTMMASELLLRGVERLGAIRQQMLEWLEDREYD